MFVCSTGPTSSCPRKRASSTPGLTKYGRVREDWMPAGAGDDDTVPASNHAVAAADAQHLAGDPTGARRRKERHHGGYVFGEAEAAHGIEPHELLAVLLDPGAVVGGLDQAERYRVRRDAGAAEFARERLHQGDYASAG